MTGQPHQNMGQQRIVARPKWEPNRVRSLHRSWLATAWKLADLVSSKKRSQFREPLFMVSTTNNGEDFDNYSPPPARSCQTSLDRARVGEVGWEWMTQDERSGWVRTLTSVQPLGFWGCDRASR